MTIPAPRYDSVAHVLHHLLRCAAVGLLHRDPNGVVIVSGLRANETQIWGASYLDFNGWLIRWDETDGGHGYCLSPAGTAVLDRWDTALWGPPGEAPVSSRPLSPPCLGDSPIDVEARRLIAAADLDALNDCFCDGTDTP